MSDFKDVFTGSDAIDTEKSHGHVPAYSVDDDSSSESFDRADMLRLGKKQEYKRTFGFTATLGFASVYTLTWEYVLISTAASLSNGGFAGAIWEYLWTAVGFFLIVISLAEMASMAPTAGGQYHWTSEFAPPRMQRVLSYISGWTSVVAWQPALAASLYPLVTLISACRTYFDANAAFTNWQLALLMIGFGFSCVPLNTFWKKALPTFENAALAIHFAGFVATLVPLWVLAPKEVSASEVFGDVVNSAGWSNTGVSVLVGQVAMLFTMAGPDSVVHMSEEVKDAAVTIPRAMIWSFIINNVMGFIMLITMCFCIGKLEDNVAGDAPFINLFIHGVGSPGGAVGLTVILILLMFICNATALATQCRQLWAFARDNGLPFSKWQAKINKSYEVPLNALWVSIACMVVLSLIQLGSTTAFNIVISINLVGSLLTYIVSIGSLLSARWRGQKLPHARFSLGRLGAPINIIALLYASLLLIFALFPIQVPVTPDNMNWAVVIVGFVLLVATVFYIFLGRRTFVGPVAYVEGQRVGSVIQTTEGDERAFE